MGRIRVEGLGLVDIAGEAPDQAETQAIMGALQQTTQQVTDTVTNQFDRFPPDPPAPLTAMDKLRLFSDSLGENATRVRRALTPFDNDYNDLGIAGNAGLYVDALRENAVDKLIPKDPARLRGDALRMTGGMVGAALGSPLGPPGMVGGGGLGAAIGDTINSMIDGKTGEELVVSALKTGAEDAFVSTGVNAITKPVIHRGLARLYGLATPEVKHLADIGRKVRIPLGAVDVGGMIPKIFKSGLGVFPILASTYTKFSLRQRSQIALELSKISERAGPSGSLDEVAEGAVKKASQIATKMFAGVSRLYDKADGLVSGLADPKVIDTAGIKAAIKGLKLEAPRPTSAAPTTPSAILDASGNPAFQVASEGGEAIGKPLGSKLTDYLASLSKLEGRQTIQQLRSMQKDLSAFRALAKQEGFDIRQINQVAKSLDDALVNMDLTAIPAGQATAIAEAYQTANQQFAKASARFETATAKKFLRVDKNLGTKSAIVKPGTIEADEAGSILLNVKSALAIKETRKLIGGAEFNKARGAFFEGATGKALSVDPKTSATVFNPVSLEASLGLSAGSRNSEAAIEEMLRGSGVTVQELRNFITAAKQVGEVVVPSQLVKRRAALGGSQALVRGLTMQGLVKSSTAAGAAAGTASHGLIGSIPKLGLILLAVRRIGRGLVNPQTLKTLTNIMDDGIPEKTRRAMVARLLNESFTEAEQPRN